MAWAVIVQLCWGKHLIELLLVYHWLSDASCTSYRYKACTIQIKKRPERVYKNAHQYTNINASEYVCWIYIYMLTRKFMCLPWSTALLLLQKIPGWRCNLVKCSDSTNVKSCPLSLSLSPLFFRWNLIAQFTWRPTNTQRHEGSWRWLRRLANTRMIE